jgi:hypothetical protein
MSARSKDGLGTWVYPGKTHKVHYPEVRMNVDWWVRSPERAKIATHWKSVEWAQGKEDLEPINEQYLVGQWETEMGYPVLRVVPPEALRGLFQVHCGQSDQPQFPRNNHVGNSR